MRELPPRPDAISLLGAVPGLALSIYGLAASLAVIHHSPNGFVVGTVGGCVCLGSLWLHHFSLYRRHRPSASGLCQLQSAAGGLALAVPVLMLSREDSIPPGALALGVALPVALLFAAWTQWRFSRQLAARPPEPSAGKRQVTLGEIFLVLGVAAVTLGLMRLLQ